MKNEKKIEKKIKWFEWEKDDKENVDEGGHL